jgi:hypothetical protein
MSRASADLLVRMDLGVDQRHVHRGVPEHFHDRVELGAAFGELGADGVPEPGSGDGPAHARAALLAARTGQTGGLAGVVDRGLEQVEARHELAVTHEQVADLLAGAVVGEGPLGTVFAQADDRL